MSNRNFIPPSRPATGKRRINRPSSFGPLGAAVVVLALVFSSGCESGAFSATLDRGVKKLFKPKRTPQQHILIAVSDVDPDIRRRSAAKVAESKQYGEEWAIKGFIAIAALESDPQTRCVAIRGLGRSRDRRAAETFLKILNYREFPAEQVQPPGALCRWDTTAALADIAAESLPEDQRQKTMQTFLEHLKADPDRNVRTAAARGLQYFSQTPALLGLIEGLRDENFAVAYQCEMSLAYMTGVTYGCNPYPWEQWYEENREHLFAQGGELPDSKKPPYQGRWDKFSYQTKQMFHWLFPGKKEE